MARDFELEVGQVVSVGNTDNWESGVEYLNDLMLRETPLLIDRLFKHLMKIGEIYNNVLEQATSLGHQKKLKGLMRREIKDSYRRDLKVAHALIEWRKKINYPKVESELATIFSEVGLGVGFGLLGKLPDTYSKPNVRAIDIDKRRDVSITIFEELAAMVKVANETDPKNDIKLADVGNLIKTFNLPEVGDRIEFDKTVRGIVVEEVPGVSGENGQSGSFDGVLVRIDGSGEEKLFVRGQSKVKEEKPAQLHEAAIIRGDDPKMHGQTVVVKEWMPGEESAVQVLRLDGTSVILPAKDLVKAPAKQARVVGDLLHLVSESGALEKVESAVNQAKLPLLEQIDLLNQALETSHKEGRIYAVSALREQGKLGDFRPEIFNDLPIAQRIEVIGKMPQPDKQEIWAQLGSEIFESKSVDVNPERVIEIQAGDAVVAFDRPQESTDWAEVVANISAPISEILPEEQELELVDRPIEQDSEVEVELDELGF